MGWTIIKHWAELALALAVLHMFQNCHGLLDVLKVIRDADDITRLGIVTACAIASNGFGGMVHALARGIGLAEVWRIVRRVWARSKNPGKSGQ
jgi:hypothetical protein